MTARLLDAKSVLAGPQCSSTGKTSHPKMLSDLRSRNNKPNISPNTDVAWGDHSPHTLHGELAKSLSYARKKLRKVNDSKTLQKPIPIPPPDHKLFRLPPAVPARRSTGSRTLLGDLAAQFPPSGCTHANREGPEPGSQYAEKCPEQKITSREKTSTHAASFPYSAPSQERSHAKMDGKPIPLCYPSLNLIPAPILSYLSHTCTGSVAYYQARGLRPAPSFSDFYRSYPRSTTPPEDFNLALDIFNDLVTGRAPGTTSSEPNLTQDGISVAQHPKPDIYTYTSLISIAARTLSGSAVRRATSLLQASGIPPNRITHLALLRYFTLTSQLSGVRSTLSKMRDQNLELGLDEEIKETARRLQEEEHIIISRETKADEITFTTMVQIMAYHGNFSAMLSVLMDMITSPNTEVGSLVPALKMTDHTQIPTLSTLPPSVLFSLDSHVMESFS
ncbi:hypothetical protein BD779DRAFT_1667191 [Infundibulicybe gibba]|nr:hypothetical protein BD779DRAFT_1667191 [Infundibulicybe gibba]